MTGRRTDDHKNPDVPTVKRPGRHDRQLLCFLEQLIPWNGQDYACLTPWTPRSACFRMQGDGSPS